MTLVFGFAAPASAASPIGYWRAIDTDGSYLKLIVYSDYYTYSLDEWASVCGGGLAKIYGPGTYYARSRKLLVDWTVSCASGPLLGPYPVTLIWDGANTMHDSTGVTWHRA